METEWAWHPVKSSNVAALRYKRETRELQIRFRSGATYSYASVPQWAYESLAAAPSVGGYLNAIIKPLHAATRLPDAPAEERGEAAEADHVDETA